MAASVKTTMVISEKGVGRRDYQKTVASAAQRSAFTLRADQTLLSFALFLTDDVAALAAIKYAKSPLAPGASAHLVNMADDLDLPYAMANAYRITLLSYYWTFDQDVGIYGYQDSVVTGCWGITPAGSFVYEAPISAYGTTVLDPTAGAHTYDIRVFNKGGANLSGGINVLALLEPVGLK